MTTSTRNIAQRIQALRKARGLSQEELAEQIGVSRQAVSKWEAEQSQPELEKLILLSEYFGVSCDYLIKGVEPEARAEKPLFPSEGLTVVGIISTAVNLIALILSCGLFSQFWNTLCIAVAFIGFALGAALYLMVALGAGHHYHCEGQTIPRALLNFCSVNVWIFAFPVLSLLYNLACGGRSAPYPLRPLPFFFLYLITCLCVTALLQAIKRRRKG